MKNKKLVKIRDIPVYDIQKIPSSDYYKSPKAVESGEEISSLQDTYDFDSPTNDSLKKYD